MEDVGWGMSFRYRTAERLFFNFRFDGTSKVCYYLELESSYLKIKLQFNRNHFRVFHREEWLCYPKTSFFHAS